MSQELKRRLLVTAGCLVVWRLAAFIVAPGLNQVVVQATAFPDPSIGPALRGTRLDQLSVVAMGLGPWLNAFIICSLAGVVSEDLGARIRRRPALWITSLTAVLGFVQSYGLTFLWQSTQPPLLPENLSWLGRLTIMATVTAGTLLMVFLGWIVDERGIGFGVCPFALYVLVTAKAQVDGIARIASHPDRALLVTVVAMVSLVAAAVVLMRAARPYGGRAARTLLPVIPGGILLPPLFADSILFFPLIVANYLGALPDYSPSVRAFQSTWSPYGQAPVVSALYLFFWMALIIAFSYFVFRVRESWWPRRAASALARLSLVGGVAVALGTVVVPVLAWWIGHVRVSGSIPLIIVGLGWPMFLALHDALVRPAPKGQRAVGTSEGRFGDSVGTSRASGLAFRRPV